MLKKYVNNGHNLSKSVWKLTKTEIYNTCTYCLKTNISKSFRLLTF